MDGGAVGVWCRKNEKLVHLLIALCLGQVVSFVMALMSFSSSYLADLGVDAPLTQSFFMYLSLAVVYGSIMLYRRKKLLVPWYYYILLGFVDVQGNYLVNKAYQYSSITSVTLLDCWTIPWVFILTWFFIGTRYSIWQYVGAAICIVGLGLIFLSDAGVGDDDGSRPILGDILVVVGTLFYALSNVAEEFCVKMKDLVEVVCTIGVFGMLVSIGEIAIFERTSLESIEWSTDIGFVHMLLHPSCSTPLLLTSSSLVELHCSISPFSHQICGLYSSASFSTNSRLTGYTMFHLGSWLWDSSSILKLKRKLRTALPLHNKLLMEIIKYWMDKKQVQELTTIIKPPQPLLLKYHFK